MEKEKIILVDEFDRAIGIAGKMEVHQKGLLHRAFSVLIFNSEGKILLQQRASSKYHTGGLWSNACCSHPRPNEEVLPAATRRLSEELGFVCQLTPLFKFIYKKVFHEELIEYEYDHVLIGRYNGHVICNPNEVKDHIWMDYATLYRKLHDSPTDFTPWFHIIMKELSMNSKKEYFKSIAP